MPAFSATALLVVLYIGFAAYLATLVFPAGTAEGDAVMSGYAEAAWQLLILLTTANFPDVMMPAYTQVRLRLRVRVRVRLRLRVRVRVRARVRVS